LISPDRAWLRPSQSGAGCAFRLPSFRGAWTIARTIAPEGALDGTASFSPRPDSSLDYYEHGELRLTGGSFRAERRYVFEPTESGFRVWFSGKPRRLFHEITLREDRGALVGAATHLCGADTYESSYRLLSNDSFTVTHGVTGPRKNYVMTTHYTRIAAQQAAA
jgi:hypothetical protein